MARLFATCPLLPAGLPPAWPPHPGTSMLAPGFAATFDRIMTLAQHHGRWFVSPGVPLCNTVCGSIRSYFSQLSVGISPRVLQVQLEDRQNWCCQRDVAGPAKCCCHGYHVSNKRLHTDAEAHSFSRGAVLAGMQSRGFWWSESWFPGIKH